jgi:hypothetical protein
VEDSPAPQSPTSSLADLEEPDFDPFANVPTPSYTHLSLDGLEQESVESWIKDYESHHKNPFLGRMIFDNVLEKTISVVYNRMRPFFPQISVDGSADDYQIMIKKSLRRLNDSSLWLKREYSLSVAYLTLLYERTIQRSYDHRDENNIVTLGVAYTTLGFPQYAKPLFIYVNNRFDQQKIQRLLSCIKEDTRTGCMQRSEGDFISDFFKK